MLGSLWCSVTKYPGILYITEITTKKVTCPEPFKRCTNLAEGETGMGDNGVEDAGDGYSCECGDRRVFDQPTDTCICMGQGLSRNARADLRTYGVYSIIKQKAFEGDISRALLCMNFENSSHWHVL